MHQGKYVNYGEIIDIIFDFKVFFSFSCAKITINVHLKFLSGKNNWKNIQFQRVSPVSILDFSVNYIIFEILF